jgi:predicted Zn-dependent protease with MMP-like domain
MKPSNIKVIYKKLKDARGYCYNKPAKIEIDSTLTDIELLDTLIHEFTHHIQPYLDEDKVEKIGNEMAEFLWKQGYRKTNICQTNPQLKAK